MALSYAEARTQRFCNMNKMHVSALRGILDLTPTCASAPTGNIGLDPNLWNVVANSNTNKQLSTFGGIHFMRSSVEEFSWAHIQSQRFGERLRSANHQSQTFQGQ